MDRDKIQGILSGEEGDRAQFDMLKFVIRVQIERAFSLMKVTTANNIQQRATLFGPSINYNERGDSNYKRRRRHKS